MYQQASIGKLTEKRSLLLVIVGLFFLWSIYFLGKRDGETWSKMFHSKISNPIRNGSLPHIVEFKNGSSWTGKKIKIITWNLQGLLRDHLETRTAAVAAVILQERPDAAFFQELIPPTFSQLRESLNQYYKGVVGSPNGYRTSYFTGIFYDKTMFELLEEQTIDFENSDMGRTLLVVKLADLGLQDINLALMTSHLESLPTSKKLILEQLQKSFEVCSSIPAGYNVIFGGDLNLEDGEVSPFFLN